jgi:ribulose 1,5-bisphosphate carboxylase large subunit-like protein
VEAAMNHISVAEAAKEHEELGQAIRLWG